MDHSSDFFWVDAFSASPFGGNPAAVCVLERELADATLQNIAREFNLSETVFIWRRSSGYDIRWFTPTREVVGALTERAAVSMQVVPMPELEERLAGSFQNATALPLPRIKVKTTAKPQSAFVLVLDASAVDITDRSKQLTFVTPITETGDGDEMFLSLLPLGGRVCGRQFDQACVQLLPELFQPIPSDPTDPYIMVAAIALPPPSGSLLVAAVPGSVQPDSIRQDSSSLVTLTATIRLSKNFSFSHSPTSESPPQLAGGSPFLLRRGGSNPGIHAAVDLHSPDMSLVFPVLGGALVTPAGPDSTAQHWLTVGCLSAPDTNECVAARLPCVPPNLYTQSIYAYASGGYRAWFNHGHGLEAVQYMHLTPDTFSFMGELLPMAYSGHSGTCAPHLHFQVLYRDDQGPRRIDPWPLLQNDMSLFLLPPPSDDLADPPAPYVVLTEERDGIGGLSQPIDRRPVSELGVRRIAGADAELDYA